MRAKSASAASLVVCQILAVSAVYSPLREYSGQSFFSEWDYYGSYDNLSSGDVNFLNQADATTQHLTFVNDVGNAIIKVDNTSNVIWNDKRNSIRITTKDQYPVGTLAIIDAVHLPFGCSVWPSFWTQGVGTWPDAGEIDIIEGVNLMGNNQMALHTTTGCAQAPSPGQSGRTVQADCSSSATNNQGCVVAETKSNSFGAGFAQAGGGVFATQFDVAGIFIWFWSRPDVPEAIKNSTSTSTIDTSTWGTPSASWPASGCNVTQFFKPQQLILEITLCGTFANATYTDTCHSPKNLCYDDNVVGPGSPTYDDAYFEIPYLRTYTLGTPPSISANASTSASAASTTSAKVTGVIATSTSTPTSSGLQLQTYGALGALLWLSFSLWLSGSLSF